MWALEATALLALVRLVASDTWAVLVLETLALEAAALVLVAMVWVSDTRARGVLETMALVATALVLLTLGWVRFAASLEATWLAALEAVPKTTLKHVLIVFEVGPLISPAWERLVGLPDFVI